MKKRSNRNLRKSRTGARGWPTMWVLAALAWGPQFRSSEPAEKTRLAWQYMFVTKYRGAGHRRIPGGGWPSRLPASGLVRDSISKIIWAPLILALGRERPAWSGVQVPVYPGLYSDTLSQAEQNIVKSERMTLDIDRCSSRTNHTQERKAES